ncbi:enoyl-CoA hydratase [Panacagrimonas perspica]|uniref:Enoyl-CoA hydratase n=1 Tax=Panacagrimonas perspica TaxID=381431 RepID=A0A4R7NTX8_9GAMM|nr:enoyl-CoA hydratase/isomerase family protein [Panacagrimonas perspica]TDU24169.1 enoyl-CoA hydratase [Panacagrimonas perspica]
MFEITRQADVVVLSMRHGKANTMDVEFCEGLARQFRELDKDPCRAIVLVGQGRIFSAGVDLLRIVDGGHAYVQRFLPALSAMFDAVFECSKPVIAAVNGASIAGGCVLACAADHRIMAEGARTGVPELKVGVPFPTSAAEIMRFTVTPQYLQSVLYGAGTYAGADALQRGLADEIVAPEAVLERATALAASYAELPPKAYALTKRQLREGTIRRIRQDGPAYDSEALAQWSSAETGAGIRAYIEKTFKPAK